MVYDWTIEMGVAEMGWDDGEGLHAVAAAVEDTTSTAVLGGDPFAVC